MGREAEPLFLLRDVSAGYEVGFPVLHHLHLEIPRGCFLGILGPNGAGKSTLLRVLSGVLPPMAGEVLWEGMPLRRFSRREIARRIAVVAQALPPLFGWTGWEWVQMGRSPHLRRFQALGERDREAVRRAMAQTQTLSLRHRSVQEMSDGERQRLALARALAQEPQVLLLDEPTAHLDLHHQVELLDLLRRWRDEEGLTLVWVSHDWNLAAEYCDHLVVLHQGHLFARGGPEEVLREEVLKPIYGDFVQVVPHPLGKGPFILPRSGRGEEGGSEPSSEPSAPPPWGRAGGRFGPRRRRWMALGWGVAACLALLVAIGVGPVPIPLGEVVRILMGGKGMEGAHEAIVWDLRLPRSLLAFCVGSALAVAGALMQALFQNPMAGPYVVGVSSGAALGAAVALLWNLPWEVAGLSAASVLAFLGGLGVAVLVMALSRRGGRIPIATLLLTGLALGALTSALTALLLFLFQRDLQRVVFWTMGSFAGRRWIHLWTALPWVLLGLGGALALVRELNLMLLGEEEASHLGLNVSRMRILLLLLATLLAASSAAVSGIIGFVDLIVPHLLRLMVGPDHRWLLPTSALAGGTLLALADTVARSLLPGELPVGILTALLGAPFFLFLLLRTR